jgi:uncharacterized protein YuzE
MAEVNLLNVDLKKLIEEIEKKYGIKLPEVIKSVYADDRGETLYIEFSSYAEYKEGEPTKDGEVILYYNETNKVVAIEILYPKEYIEKCLLNRRKYL